MLNKKYYLQHTVDVYVTELKDEKVRVTFHRMTTREKVEIVTSKIIAEFLALLDGRKSAHEILIMLGAFEQHAAINLIEFLLAQHLITEDNGNVDSQSRYARQIAYLDDMILDRKGHETQKILESKKIAIIGCGAVTGNIAENLARAGIQKFILVDFKDFKRSNLSRHLFSRASDIGKSKAEVLANYLKKIDSRIKIEFYKEKLLPNSNLSKWFDQDVNLVINGCDEPYIGHTSVKLGRFLQTKNIALYVSGGFDAHLMSSGELVYPPNTPCIDCIQKTFSNALSDWKPIYSRTDDIEPLVSNINKKINIPTDYAIGGPGGIASMSGYSAFLSTLKIIHFLSEDSQYNYSTIRYEYLPNSGELTKFTLLKQGDCNACNR
ncbi:thiamine biosynthesis protein ThiF [Brenneria alni]|uniref:Thiamine biosynthesis protein ThiF n=1 Tax=Brenneria alni TaxID=71656 RepID=A0A421DIX3_9GAMM|nr:ThiF family adenylyltransferase [Brenneria alni]RLM17689.1 thiamine biosynthesis protein ThiF [Brenneria alni]